MNVSHEKPVRIAVLGYLVRGPIGGMAWHHLQYVLGLVRLGHDVMFIEDSDDYPSCYDPTRHETTEDPAYGLDFARRVFERLDASVPWAYFDGHTRRWLGPAAEAAPGFCRSCDVVLNVSGVNPLRDWLGDVPRRVLIDTDPAFTQVKRLTDSVFAERVNRHNEFFTFGELIPTGMTGVPDDGIAWRATRQPVVLDQWTAADAGGDCYTTVMQWESYPPRDFDGRRFGTKRESFALIEDLPGLTDCCLEIALGGSTAPREKLQSKGWRLCNPLTAAADPWAYQQYLRHSRGELSVAKHAYVATQCGWFSERTACYLASGRPAIVQDTGFTKLIPTGGGLHAFTDLEEASAALRLVETNYNGQCRQARRLAEELFDSDAVLSTMLDEIFS